MTASIQPNILCIGSVMWDIIGRSSATMRAGSDVPGHISRLPGGVAMNIAMTLRQQGMRPALLSAVGRDPEGDELIAQAAQMGLITDHLYRSDTLPTDRYMAVEGANGLIAAIADAHSLEKAGDKILRPLEDGTFGSAAHPWSGPVALDGNLTEKLLGQIATSPLFVAADLRVAPASPGKAGRLMALLGHPVAMFYVNLEEANLLCCANFTSSQAAAEALVKHGVRRVAVTDGANSATIADTDGHSITMAPPAVASSRVTGAGDTFMAAHIAAESTGLSGAPALTKALQAAAHFVSGQTAQ